MRQSTEQELQIKGMEALKLRRGQELLKIEETVRVKTMLEQNLKMDETQECMDHLKEMIEAGRTNLNKFAFKELSKYEADPVKARKVDLNKVFQEELQNDLSKFEDKIKERIQSFFNNAPKYDGNMEKMFKW